MGPEHMQGGAYQTLASYTLVAPCPHCCVMTCTSLLHHILNISLLLQEREVQATVVEQRKKVMKAAAVARATRNSTKPAKGKGTKGKGGAADKDFGGW